MAPTDTPAAATTDERLAAVSEHLAMVSERLDDALRRIAALESGHVANADYGR